MLKCETACTLGAFLFEDILCRWGAVEEIVTNNGTTFVAAVTWLTQKYGIHHIRISAYNSKANGIIERSHHTIQDSLVKACNGDITQWPVIVPHIFWANRVTMRRATGHSPYFMAHGVEPLLPFDVSKATFMLPDLITPLSTTDLIALRAQQLMKRNDDLTNIHLRVLNAHFSSIKDFKCLFAHTIHDFDFRPGTLVLILNKKIEPSSNVKCKPRYFSPMLVVSCLPNGLYHLAEIDGTLSKLKFATFCLIPYFPCSMTSLNITQYINAEDLASVSPEGK
jgi:hypothetical protein